MTKIYAHDYFSPLNLNMVTVAYTGHISTQKLNKFKTIQQRYFSII